MNIAIITLPLHVNYGGILQAYALQRVLSLQGHNVTTLDIPSKIKKDLSIYRQIRAFVGTSLNVLIGRDKFSNIYWPFNNNKRNLRAIRMSMRPFINRIMKLSPPLSTAEELQKYFEDNELDGVIVGSDQVWRPCYNSNIDFSFLSFIPESSEIKRIVISASFGTNEWEFSNEQTERFLKLAQLFKAISVREFSGVRLCNQYLHVNAIQTIDPTMLLNKTEYDKIIESDIENTVSIEDKIFSYIIDETKTKRNIIKMLNDALNCKVFELNPNERPRPYSSEKTALKTAPKPLAQWLRAIKDSKFVITDSFHGAVFSILYHKPFIILSNKSRGQARIETLLKLFDLNSRLVNTEYNPRINKVNLPLEDNIDWNHVDKTLENKRSELQNHIVRSLND